MYTHWDLFRSYIKQIALRRLVCKQRERKKYLAKLVFAQSGPHSTESCYERSYVKMATAMTTAGILLPDWL